MSDVSFANFAEWEKAILAAVDDLAADTEASMRDLAQRIAKREEAAAPDRSRVKAAFTVEESRPSANEYVIDVGPEPWQGTRLAHFEFGTSKQPPRPFMRPITLEEWAEWNPGR